MRIITSQLSSIKNMSPASHKSPQSSPRFDPSVAIVTDKDQHDVKDLMEFIRQTQGGLLRESTEMRLYSKLPDIGCSTTLPRPIDTNLLHSNHPASLDTNKPLRHHRTSSDVTDIVRPVGLQQSSLNDGKPLPRPAGHGPGLRLNTMRQLPPLRRHSIADAPHLERPHHPLPE